MPPAHSHSLIIKGDDRASLYKEAARLASGLVCLEQEPSRRPCDKCAHCRQIQLETYPYWFPIAPEGKANQIKIAQVRALQAALASKAGVGQAKIALFFDAHRMREESQNCLLKTLEEPPPDTLLLLLTGRPQDLLPTIRSRCETIEVAAKGPAPAQSDLDLVWDLLRSIREQGYHGVFEKAAFVTGSRKNELPAFLDALACFFRNGMVDSLRGGAVRDGAAFVEGLDEIWRAGYLLERNVNALLVLENLFLKFKRLEIPCDFPQGLDG